LLRRRNALDGDQAQNRDESRQGDATPEGNSSPNETGAAGDVRWDKISEILEAVNGRWAVHLLRHLASGVYRPADLLVSVNADTRATLGRTLSNKIMFEALRRLSDLGLVRRVEVMGGRPETRYWLTHRGHGMLADIVKIGASDFGRFPLTAHDPGTPDTPSHFDPATPSPARIWNYWIGGKDNFAADREVGDATALAMPELPVIARYVRQFQASAIDRLLDRGVRQFLDIGTGLPVAGSVHEVAQRAAPESRVVYVDNDPLVLTHARALLTSSTQGACDYLDADLREPKRILARASQTLDLARPTALLLLGVLHFLSHNDDPWGIVTRLLDGITGDAYLVIGHAASDVSPPEIGEAARRYNERSPVQIVPRSHEEIARFFSGMQMLAPGLVPLGSWWPDRPEDDALGSNRGGHVGIGRRSAKTFQRK
jgi:DNA-binding HxlR family transcriptional regulator